MAENNAIAEEVLASTAGGRPVVKIITNEDGNIVGHLAKWQQIVKFHVDRYLDFGCRQFRRQEILNGASGAWDGGERMWLWAVEARALNRYICNYMTTFRSELKTYFRQHGRDPTKKPSECPQKVWDPLVKWWLSPEGLKEEAYRQNARANVRHTPHVGHAGALGAVLKLVRNLSILTNVSVDAQLVNGMGWDSTGHALQDAGAMASYNFRMQYLNVSFPTAAGAVVNVCVWMHMSYGIVAQWK